jgi:secreted Zn-dependent insulinase-like peptidase
MLEHMLFKGTTSRAAGRIDQEVQEAGGYMNAYTSFDRTVYYINVPNTGAFVAIDILCDIMRNATLPAEEVEKEKQVILREMDMNQDDPGRRSSRRLFETAYTRSPYRFTIIGYPDIFKQVQREDLLAFYHEKYAPNNIFVVVVGDIKAEEAEKHRCLRLSCLTNRNKRVRAKSSRKRPSNWDISTLPGTSRTFGIRTFPPWMCWPPCLARGTAPDCTRKYANAKASPIPPMHGRTIQAILDCSE